MKTFTEQEVIDMVMGYEGASDEGKKEFLESIGLNPKPADTNNVRIVVELHASDYPAQYWDKDAWNVMFRGYDNGVPGGERSDWKSFDDNYWANSMYNPKSLKIVSVERI